MPSITNKHRSQTTHRAVIDNINRKLLLLEKWIETGSIPWRTDEAGDFLLSSTGDPEVDWFPRTVVDFVRWTGLDNSASVRKEIQDLGGFTSFGRSTLYRNVELKRSVISALNRMTVIAEDQRARSSRKSIIQRLEAEILIERAKKVETQSRYLDALERINKIEGALTQERRLRAADIERLKSENQELRDENARLIAAATKIVSLERTRNMSKGH